MKNLIIGALLATTILLSIKSFSPPPITTVKLAQPKAWVSHYGSGEFVNDLILKYQKQGYVVHQLSFGGYGGQAMVVLYKYY